MQIFVLEEIGQPPRDITQQVMQSSDVSQLVADSGQIFISLEQGELLYREGGMLYILDRETGTRYLLGEVSGEVYVDDERIYLWQTNTDWLGARFFDPATQDFLTVDEQFWLNYHATLEVTTELFGDIGTLDEILGEELDELLIDDRLDGLFEEEEEDPGPAPIGPGIPVITSLDGYFNIAFQTDPVILGTATNADTVDISFTYVDPDTNEETVESYQVDVTDDNWSLDLPETSPILSLPDDTSVTINLVATNIVGPVSNQLEYLVDYTPPPAPTVENAEDLGNDGWLIDVTPELTGSAEAGASVLITLTDEDGDSATYITTADPDGDWKINTEDESYLLGGEVSFDEGESAEIYIISVDPAGNPSEEPAEGFDPRTGEVDTIGASELIITSPVNGSAFSDPEIDIVGETDPNTTCRPHAGR